MSHAARFAGTVQESCTEGGGDHVHTRLRAFIQPATMQIPQGSILQGCHARCIRGTHSVPLFIVGLLMVGSAACFPPLLHLPPGFQ